MKALIFTQLILGSAIAGMAQTPQSPLSTAEQRTLDINQVEALILGRGNRHWDILGGGQPVYRVPKSGQASGSFAGSLWIAGLDNNGQLRIAANTYRQNGADFWPGPLDTTNASAYTGAAYNKIWKVSCNDIQNFVTAYNNGSVTANTYPVPADMQNYPAKGTGNFMRNMAPFHDKNNDGQYNVMDGDYPVIHGHQQILSIYNDKAAPHGETGGLPMGLEIHEYSYAYADPNLPDSLKAVNYSTYYRYEIYNRSNFYYTDVFITSWNDADLGGYTDDYIGSYPPGNFAYMYNATNTDPGVGGSVGYGNYIPVMSQAILKTNCSSDGIDNNHNGIIDEAGEQFIMDKATFYNNNIGNFNTATTNPVIAQHYYNYMKGKWKDNSPFVYGGNAYSSASNNVPTNYVFDGDPQLQTGWTEGTSANLPGDRRFLISSGPFNFPPGAKLEWGFALVCSLDSTVGNTISKFNTVVKRDVRNTQLFDELNHNVQCQPSVLPLGVKEQNNDLKVGLFPNPGRDKLTLLFNQNMNNGSLKMINVLGQTVREEKLNGRYEIKMDTEELPAGVYTISIEQKGKTTTTKWIKQE